MAAIDRKFPGGRAEVVAVTGASAGIGRAVVREFASRGASVGLIARGRKGLEGARQEVEERGGNALIVPTDVSDADQVEQAASEIESILGPIDVWVNNAMTTVFSPFLDMPVDEYRRVTEVTYLGYVHGTMAALRRMVPRDRGVIVQVGSGVGYRGIPLQSAYSGAKHAINGFTDSVRTELRHDRSRVWVTMVHPASVNTPQFSWAKARILQHPRPFRPVFQPEMTARAVYWAAHHRRREIFVSPQGLFVNLNKVMPSFFDWYFSRWGFRSQMYDGPRGPDWRDYLWEPVDEDRGAHGDFDAEAHDASAQLWLSLHGRTVAAAAGLAAIGALAARALAARGGRTRAG